MTDVAVTQEDRNAAADLLWGPAQDSIAALEVWDRVKTGKHDNHWYVQAFARHRLSALQPRPASTVRAEVLEEAARVAETCEIKVAFAPGCADGASAAARQIASSIRALAPARGEEG